MCLFHPTWAWQPIALEVAFNVWGNCCFIHRCRLLLFYSTKLYEPISPKRSLIPSSFMPMFALIKAWHETCSRAVVTLCNLPDQQNRRNSYAGANDADEAMIDLLNINKVDGGLLFFLVWCLDRQILEIVVLKIWIRVGQSANRNVLDGP